MKTKSGKQELKVVVMTPITKKWSDEKIEEINQMFKNYYLNPKEEK